MAVKKLPGQEPKESSRKEKKQVDDKPNIREYIKANKTKDGETFVVEKCKLTDSGWLIVETVDWVGFIIGKAEVVVNLMETLAPQLHNKQGNQLVAVIAKKTKFGLVLGIDDELKCWYHLDTEASLLTLSEEEPESFLVPTGMLKLEDFLGTQSM